MAKLIEKLKKEVKKTKPKTKSISIHLREDYVEALDIISSATGKTRSEIVMEAIDEVGLTNEKNLEYFKSIIETQNQGNNQGVQNESNTTQTI